MRDRGGITLFTGSEYANQISASNSFFMSGRCGLKLPILLLAAVCLFGVLILQFLLIVDYLLDVCPCVYLKETLSNQTSDKLFSISLLSLVVKGLEPGDQLCLIFLHNFSGRPSCPHPWLSIRNT